MNRGRAAGSGDLYAPLELAKGAPLTYGSGGADSAYGKVKVGGGSAYSSSFSLTETRYGAAAPPGRAYAAGGTYSPVGAGTPPPPQATSSTGTYSDLTVAKESTDSARYGNMTLSSPSAYGTASSMNNNARPPNRYGSAAQVVPPGRYDGGDIYTAPGVAGAGAGPGAAPPYRPVAPEGLYGPA